MPVWLLLENSSWLFSSAEVLLPDGSPCSLGELEPRLSLSQPSPPPLLFGCSFSACKLYPFPRSAPHHTPTHRMAKTTEMNSLTALEAGSANLTCQQDHVPSDVPGGTSSMPGSWLQAAPLRLPLFLDTSLPSLPPSSHRNCPFCIRLCPSSLLLRRTPVIGFGRLPIQ